MDLTRYKIEEVVNDKSHVQSVFSTIRENFTRLRMTAVQELRPRSARYIQDTAKSRLLIEASKLFHSLCETARTSQDSSFDKMDRLIFASTSVVRFSYLVELVVDKMNHPTIIHGRLTSLRTFFHSKVEEESKPTIILRNIFAQQIRFNCWELPYRYNFLCSLGFLCVQCLLAVNCRPRPDQEKKAVIRHPSGGCLCRVDRLN